MNGVEEQTVAEFSGTLTWLGHSTFHLETPRGRSVLLEGFVDNCPTCPPEWHGLGGRPLDLILLTHAHVDHIADAPALAERSGCTIAGMVELMGWMGKQGVDASRLVDFNKGGTVELCGLKVTMVTAHHSSSTPDGAYAGEPAGFVIELEDGYRIYHAGDTCLFGDMELIGRLYRPDLALLPIGGHYTMDPVHAAIAATMLGVSDVIGMHWGTFPPLKGRPAQLAETLRLGSAGPDGSFPLNQSVRVHELQPGESFGRSPVVA